MGVFDGLKRLFGGNGPSEAEDEETFPFVLVKIPEALDPEWREEKYEAPLGSALEAAGAGEVTGGVCEFAEPNDHSRKNAEWCGVYVELEDYAEGLPLVRRTLRALGAPDATVLEYEREGKLVREPLGTDADDRRR